MKGSMRAAAAIGVGYLLGRRKKFRMATMLAAATAVGGTTVGGIALKRGMKMLGSSDALQKVAPQLGQLTDVVRGDLLAAGKAAASSALSNRMDALTDSLHDRAERVRNPEAAVADSADTAAKTGKKAAGAGKKAAGGTATRAASAGRGVPDGGVGRRVSGRGRVDEDEDYDSRDEDMRDEDVRDDDYEDDDYQDEEEDYEPETDDGADDADDEAGARPAQRARPARSGSVSGTRRRSPVTRTRG